MHRHSLGDRLRYAFDNFMARGTLALVGALFVASAALVLALAAAVVLLGGLEDEATASIDFIELVWMAALRTLDPGTMADDAGSLVFVFGMLGATLGGVLLVAILIGLVTSGIEGRLTDLRRGRSRVIETGHTVVLGWSSQGLTLIEQLVEANASRARQCIVVLAERDKLAMEEALRERIPNQRTTRIVCRSGSPIDPADIDICSPQTARSIVVLSHEDVDSDADVVKTLLAIGNAANPLADPNRVVAEIQDPRNAEVARLAGGGRARVMIAGDVIGRIAAQACRQPGLSVVYEELLDFAGDEIYFSDHLGLAGRTFGEALLEFGTSALIGLAPPEGRARLNPPMETVIGRADRLVLIARDESSIVPTPVPAGVPAAERIVRPAERVTHPETTLVLGWNRRAASLLGYLDSYLPPGSETLVVSGHEQYLAAVESTSAQMRNSRVTFRHDDTGSRRVIDELIGAGWDRAVILPYSDILPPDRADARTLVTLLHLRDAGERAGVGLSIVTEMLDLRNRELARVTRADDFIVSQKLVSQMLAQLSENPGLEEVFGDLFDVAGSEIYLHPAVDYVRLDSEPPDFYTLVEAARRRSQVAIGYRLMAHADDAARNYGVVLNPDKAAPLPLAAEDQLVVLSES